MRVLHKAWFFPTFFASSVSFHTGILKEAIAGNINAYVENCRFIVKTWFGV